MLDLNALRTFVLVADDLNFTTVAARRNTVQSAISAQVKRLEDTTGKTLVARGRGQSMSLTPEGRAFLVYARRILALSAEAVETVRTAQSRRIIRLGTTVTLAMSVVSEALARFAARQPNVQIHIFCDRSDALLDRLDREEIDIAFMMDQGRRAGRVFVHSQPLLWACADGFELETGAPVPLAFLTDGRDLRHYALAALDDAGLTGHVSHLSPHPIGVRALVQAGLAVTVMPQSTIVAPLQAAPAHLGLPPLATIALAAYAGKTAGAAEMDDLSACLESCMVSGS
ncbi:MAG: LysR substrate-binding domain-containing protein [Pseudomonadota bacterium]